MLTPVMHSVDLAQVLLQQRHSNVKDALLDRDALSSAHVVELGFALINS